MGYSDRNYAHSCSGGWGSGPASWPDVCKWIVFVNVAVFLAQILITRPPTAASPGEHFGSVEDEERFIRDWVEQQKIMDRMLERITDRSPGSPHPGEPPADGEPRAAGEPPGKDEPPAAETSANSVADDTAARERAAELRQEAVEAYREFSANTMRWQPRISPVQDWLELDTHKVLKGQIWRIVTCAFCHDRYSILHILFNMLGLIWFGIALETMYGSREFLLFYLASAVAAGLAHLGLDLYSGPSVPAIGASGAVMGVLMLFACHFPYHRVMIWYFFPLEVRWLVLLYVAFDLHPVLLTLSGEADHSGIAHSAHLGGLGFGFLYWTRRLRLTPLLDRAGRIRWRTLFRRKPQLRLHKPVQDVPPDVTENLLREKALDSVLEKISREGRNSLTDDELDLLIRESERRRSRPE